jgi:hypothetical protein
MPPQIIAALIGVLGPQLLGRLFGGGGNQDKLRQQVLELLSAESVNKQADANQAAWYRSPAYGAAQAASLAAGRMAETEVGRAGAGVTSGMDVLRGAASAGLGTATLGKFNADAYLQSRDLAQRQREASASALLGVGVSPDINREMLGASLNFLGPLLGSWLKKKYNWGDTTPSAGRSSPPDRWSW